MKPTAPLSIYVVDDDKLFTTSLTGEVKKMFKKETNVQSFSTGEECLKHFEQPPNIMILDYFLNSSYPEAMNGLEVLKKVMAVSPDTKVIMLSSQDKIEIAVNLIKYGAYDYIIKNDRIFLRTKMVVNNAAHSISVSEELKSVKLMTRMVSAIVGGVIVICIMIQLFFPTLFTKG